MKTQTLLECEAKQGLIKWKYNKTSVKKDNWKRSIIQNYN